MERRPKVTPKVATNPRLRKMGLALGYSPAYLTENSDGIRRDWPRIPLPADRKALEASAALGEQIAVLLDTEDDVPGVTNGKFQPLFLSIAALSKIGDGNLDPNTNDFAVTAGWGHFGKEGVTMPGKGILQERDYNEDEAKAIDAEATARGMSAEDARRLLGEKTCDVYLNLAAYWRNIPLNVWEYYIGGYQVIKKWLSYREGGILGRALKPEEVREVMNMARRLAAIRTEMGMGIAAPFSGVLGRSGVIGRFKILSAR